MIKKSNQFWFKNWDSENIKHLIRCKKIYSRKSKYQKIEILDSKVFGRILTLDNQIQIATKFNSYVHESLVHPAFLSVPNITDVLIIGGGDCFSLKEVLKYKTVKKIDMVEIDKEVVEVSKTYFPEVSKYISDPRVNIEYRDGADFVKITKSKYDIIILDIADPSGPAFNIFTKEFLLDLKKIMKKESAVITHCESPDSAGEIYYSIISTFREVFKKVSPFRVWIPHYIDFWGRLVASDDFSPIDLDLKEIEDRISKNGINFEWLTPELFYSVFRSFSKDIKDRLSETHVVLSKDRKICFSRP